jgi:hypothetical protein
MFLPITFIVSGIIIVALIGAKMIEDSKKRKPLLLRLVSLGDERVRNWGIEFAHRYSDFKAKSHLYITNQLPLRAKNYFNKLVTLSKERLEKHVGDIRGSKLLKKSDGLSEYLKNISERQGEGRVDEVLDVPDDTLKS